MKQTLRFIAGLLALLLLCAGCGSGDAKVLDGAAVEEGFAPMEANGMETLQGALGYVATLTSSESGTTHEVRLRYPKSMDEHFNRVMRLAASEEMKQFHLRRSSSKNKNTLTMDYEIKLVDEGIISILLLSKSVVDDAAKIRLIPHNFSLKTGYPLKLGDLFTGKDYEAVLIQRVGEELARAFDGNGPLSAYQNGRDHDRLLKDLAITANDLSSFYLDDGELCFVFEEGRVAPKECGPVVVALPVDSLKDHLAERESISGVEPTPFPTPTPVPTPDHTDTGRKYIALTFDDGPHATQTPRLLDILEEKNVKATFFMLGTCVENNPDIVKQVYDEGHLVCSHTYGHKNLNTLSASGVKSEIDKTDKLIKDIIGHKPKYIRPPYGNANATVKKTANRVLVNWSIDPEDWKHRNAQKIADNVVSAAKDGYIILCHDIYSETVNAVPMIIDRLRAKGYEFVTVDRLFEIYGTNPQAGTIVRMAK